MQFIAASIALLAAAVSAIPTPASVTVQITNDQSGRNSNIVVPLGSTQDVSALLQAVGSPLEVGGTFFATSFFLQAHFQSDAQIVECDLTNNGQTFVVTDRQTFKFIGYQDLVDATIYCKNIAP